jgi:hypothetical protein
MVGANPKNHQQDVLRRVALPGATAFGRPNDGQRRRWAGLACLFVPLSLLLVQCGRAPNAGALAANVSGSSAAATAATFEERFPKPEFRDRFPAANEALPLRQMADFGPKRVQTQTYRVASLEPTVPYKKPSQPIGEEVTTLVSMKSSAFPYYGSNPASEAPFLNISSGARKGHRSYSGRVYWQDQTYNDSRVLVHIPENFDVQKPGVIVVFFHGNGATLERDVRDRQMVPQQISDSGVNAVLLAPQMAVDAADSSAGKFWQPGGFKRFMEEAVGNLAKLYGDPSSAKAFEKMPIVIVGYSGGFLPTAWSLEVGGISDRVRGVILLDAVYGELEKFASWIENHRKGFFVSSYTHYTARRDHELMHMLRDKGITVSESMDGSLRPGSVVFVETGEGITHRDYVTQAWTRNPIEQVLVKMAAPSMRMAAGSALSSSR